METEDQDSEYKVENLYRQEFELLKSMFEDHFSSEVIAGVLEDCDGDVNLAVDTLTKIEDTPSDSASVNISPETPKVECNSTEVTECKSEMTPLNPNAPSFAAVSRAIAPVATGHGQPPQKGSPPRSKNHMPKIDYWTNQMRKIVEDYNQGHRVLVIMRGAPGSGKSYLARVIVDSTVGTANISNYRNHIFSSDDYMTVRGRYQYDVNRNAECHMKNQSNVLKAFREGRSPVIVDNTNMQVWEMYPYLCDGVFNGYIVEVLEPSNPWSKIPSQLAKRNSHGVPLEKIRVMLHKFEGNVSGEKLIKNCNLKYPKAMEPPVKRNIPPYPNDLPLSHVTKKILPVPNTTLVQTHPQSTSALPNRQVASQFKCMNSNNNETRNNTASMSKAINLNNQLQQIHMKADIKVDELRNAEASWASWEISQTDSHHNVAVTPSLDPKPQRCRANEVPNKYIETSMISEVWIDNLPSMTPVSHTSSLMRVFSQNLEQTETTSTVETDNITDDKSRTLIAVSGFVNENPQPSIDQIQTNNIKATPLTLNGRCVNEKKHFIQLKRIFKNVPRAVLREIFDNCAGDVDWACSIVLDGIQHNNLEGVGDNKSDSEDDEEVDCQCQCDKPRAIEIPETFTEKLPTEKVSPNTTPLLKKKVKKEKMLSEDTDQIKRQIENTVKIADNHYSQHYLNMRRRIDVKSPNERPGTSKENVNIGEQTSAAETISTPLPELSENMTLSATVVDAIPSTSGTGKYETSILDDEDDEEDDDDEENTNESDCELDNNVNVNIGMDFVRKLDELYNRHDFEYPEGIKPVLSIPTKILGELNALWIEAISYQMDKIHSQSEAMIKQDEEFARQLEIKLQEAEDLESSLEEENATALEPQLPREQNFKEIMDTELALAIYERNVKEQWKNMEPQDMAAQMTRKKLYELFPDVREDTLSEMLIAHGNSFDSTVEVLLISTGQDHYLDETNGINKFVMEKEKENKSKLLLAEQNSALDEEEYPYLLKPGNEQTVLDLDSVNEMRAKAEKYKVDRDTLFNKAKWYYDRKKLHEADHYSRLAAIKTAKYETASNYAAAALVQYHANTYPGTNIIDLHFLRVLEAENSLDIFIDDRLRKLRLSPQPIKVILHIITGRGKHSPGRARVKPAVIRRLKYRGLQFRQTNPGMLEARLKPTHLLLEELLKSFASG